MMNFDVYILFFYFLIKKINLNIKTNKMKYIFFNINMDVYGKKITNYEFQYIQFPFR